MDLKIALAQIKTVTGDLDGNTNRILEGIKKAEDAGVDMVVFPETAISHYCCGDLFLHNGFINDQLDFLYKKIIPFTKDKKVCVLLGFVDKKGISKDGFPILSNSCAVIQDGIIQTYDKILLAKRSQHEDTRYFEPGNEIKVFELDVNGEKIKFSPVICQDIWNIECERDIVKECVTAGSDLIIALNQSYYYFGKQNIRKKLVSDHCFNHRISMVYLNSVGVGDITKNIIVYNGGSFICNENGDIVDECKSFEEDFKISTLHIDKPFDDNLVQHTDDFYNHKLTKNEKYEEIFHALKFSVKEFFDACGLKRPMVYVSGGIDSALAAVIIAKSFKSEDIIFVSSPTEDNGSVTKGNAQQIADNLGVKLYWASMQEAYAGFIEGYKNCFNEEPSPISKASFQAVGRTAQSIGISHRFGAVGNIGCSNHTENILGFSTFHDVANSSAIGLINDLTKIEIYEFSKFLNEYFEAELIPRGLYDGTIKPMAELNDNKGEDPYDYNLYAPICSCLIRYQMDVKTLIEQYKNKSLNLDEFVVWPNGKDIYSNVSLEEFELAVWKAFGLSKKSVFKSASAGPTVIISPVSRGFSSRETLINQYRGSYNF